VASSTQLTTGKLPFPGTTSAVVFDNILHSAPVAPVTLNTNAPSRTRAHPHKALEKDRDVRYQVACRIACDLKRLLRELDHGKTDSPVTLILRLAYQRKCPCRPPRLPSQRVLPRVVQCLSAAA